MAVKAQRLIKPRTSSGRTPRPSTLKKLKQVARSLQSNPKKTVKQACREAGMSVSTYMDYYHHLKPNTDVPEAALIPSDIELALISSNDGKSVFWDSLNEIESFVEQLSELQLAILDDRILAEQKPFPYKSMAQKWGISKSTLRRKTISLENNLKPSLDTIAYLINDQIGSHVVPVAEFDQTILKCFAGRDPKDRSRVHKLIFKHLGYVRHKNSMFSPAAVREAQHLADAAKTIADDDDADLVDEIALLCELSDRRWETHLDDLIDYIGLIRVHDYLTQIDTNKARVKAALLNINRPATRDEIAALSGVSADNLRGIFRYIPSIVRANQNQYALDYWVYKPYEGTWKEIQNLIDESGGSAPLEWVISEMKHQFGIKERTVRGYAKSSFFAIENGNIRLANSSEIKLTDLDEVITGHDSRGYPYWTFKIVKSYFNGHVLNNLPKEIAAELGCDIDTDSKISAEVLYPDGAHKKLSVKWALTNQYSFAHLGSMDESLRLLKAQIGMKVRLVIIGKEQVELRLE